MALPVQHELGADHLHHLAAGGLCQLLRRETGVILDIVLQNPALDEFPGLQRIVGLLDEVLPDAILADVDDGVDGVGQPSQLGSLFACQFHKIPFDRSFLIVQSILPEAAGLPAFLLDGYFFK